MLRSIGAAIALLAAVPAAARSGEPEDRAAALAQASERGALLYAYNRAAWQGTDDMVTKLRDPQASVGGYIVDGPASAPVLAFYDRAGANLL